MKVIFTHKNGRQQEMNEKDAILLSKVKRGTYQTRDLVAESTLPEPGLNPTASINPAPPVQTIESIADQLTQSVGAEVDSSGTEWNADMHTATKIKNQDGTWRKKPGAKPETAPEGEIND